MCIFCNDSGPHLNRRTFFRGAATGLGAVWAASLPLPTFAQTQAIKSGATVTDICDHFVESYIRLNPTMTGRVFGLNRGGTTVTDWSPAGGDAVVALMRDTLGALNSAPVANRKEELGAGFVEDTANSILAGYDAGEQYRKMSTHVFIGPPALLLTSFETMSQATAGEMPLEPEAIDDDWGRILERLRAVPQGIAGYRESLQYGMAKNLMAPRSMTLAVAKQCRGWATAGWFTTFANRYGQGALAAPLAEAAAAANRSYGELAEWLDTTYAPKASPEDGIGNDRFMIYADLWLGLKGLDLDEAYDWATQEYLRLEEEKRIESGRIRAGSTYDEIRHELDRDPNHTIQGVDAFRNWVQGRIDDAISRLGGAEFDIPEPMQRCVIQMATSGAGAMPYYVSPAEDFSTPGGVVWPTNGKDVLPTWSSLSTVFHESVPGHHLQLGGSRLLDLTRVQRVAGAAGHAEGWALYAERLADELGWFDTPQTRLGFDGVTTALELESGLLPIGRYYEETAKEGRPINYGASAAWTYARIAEKEGMEPEGSLTWFQSAFSKSNWQNSLATAEEIGMQRLHDMLSQLPDRVYRVKGILNLEERPRERCILQATGRRAMITVGAPWDDAPASSRIVFIAAKGTLDRRLIENRLMKGYSPPLVNDDALADRMLPTLKAFLGENAVVSEFPPATGSEDAHLLRGPHTEVPVSFTAVGIADPVLVAEAAAQGQMVPFAPHNSEFKVDLNAIPLGAKIGALKILTLMAV